MELLTGAMVMIESDNILRSFSEVRPVALNFYLMYEKCLAEFINAAAGDSVDYRKCFLRAFLASWSKVFDGAGVTSLPSRGLSASP